LAAAKVALKAVRLRNGSMWCGVLFQMRVTVGRNSGALTVEEENLEE
jgi:hypothetical protein